MCSFFFWHVLLFSCLQGYTCKVSDTQFRVSTIKCLQQFIESRHLNTCTCTLYLTFLESELFQSCFSLSSLHCCTITGAHIAASFGQSGKHHLFQFIRLEYHDKIWSRSKRRWSLFFQQRSSYLRISYFYECPFL